MWPRVVVKQPTWATEPDLYAVLGVAPGATRQEVDGAYHTLFLQTKEYEQLAHLAWKVLRDPLYAPLYAAHRSLAYLYEAGFYLDKITPEAIRSLDFAPGLLTTPYHKIIANLKDVAEDVEPIVLVTTGGFSPIHHGHIAMMEVAKRELEKRGHTVVGGYISPSHDNYVSTKYNGEAELNSDHRIYLAQLAVQDSEWLMVDPWESRYVPSDINFTDVMTRLQQYLRHYLPRARPLQLYYVFGSDNQAFTRVFKTTNGCVCIGRDNGTPITVDQEEGIANNLRIVFTKNLSSYADVSSSAVRKWKAHLMPDEVSNLYFKWRKNLLLAESVASRPHKLYVLREEDTWAIQPWMQQFGAGKVVTAKEKFKEQLVQALHDAFLYVVLPDLPVEIDIRLYHLDEQANYVDQLMRREQVLNLDACTNNGTGINFSRQFYIADGQIRARELLGRPGFPSFAEQVAALTPGPYTLVDDDIASGSTINILMGTLPETVQIVKIRTLMDYSRNMYNRSHLGSFDQEAFDAVDLRDFLIGSRMGGLVVQLPNGEEARAPYMQPYISLITRASIPPSSEMVFSRRLWEMNAEFFRTLDHVTIADLDPYVQKLFCFLGFDVSMPVADLCDWHLRAMYGVNK